MDRITCAMRGTTLCLLFEVMRTSYGDPHIKCDGSHEKQEACPFHKGAVIIK